MKITGMLADKLLDIVNNKCKGDVHLRSQYGDDFNLKSRLTQYIAISATRSISWSSSAKTQKRFNTIIF